MSHKLSIIYQNMGSKKYILKCDFFQLNNIKGFTSLCYIFRRTLTTHVFVSRYENGQLRSTTCMYIRTRWKMSETKKFNAGLAPILWVSDRKLQFKVQNASKKNWNQADIRVLYLYYIFRFWNLETRPGQPQLRFHDPLEIFHCGPQKPMWPVSSVKFTPYPGNQLSLENNTGKMQYSQVNS